MLPTAVSIAEKFKLPIAIALERRFNSPFYEYETRFSVPMILLPQEYIHTYSHL
ncbi:MAG: hypothetical protein PUP91_13105 [Rhizonema sp. PD37]|nr:hypothetical protein [Rhizonema sp. PD37]